MGRSVRRLVLFGVLLAMVPFASGPRAVAAPTTYDGLSIDDMPSGAVQHVHSTAVTLTDYTIA